MSLELAIVVDDVCKKFRLYHERNQSLKAALMRRHRVKYDEFWALRDVSFEVPEGSTFGLIGENGSGKSTLLKCIARILRPDVGCDRARRARSPRSSSLGAGFHPELSGRENVFLNGVDPRAESQGDRAPLRRDRRVRRPRADSSTSR